MTARITPQMQVGSLVRQTATHTSLIAKLQQQISSGVRVNRPSDDPLATKVILSRQALLGRYEVEKRTLAVARDRLNQSNVELLNVEQLFVRARDAASQARSALDDDEKEALARDIDSLLTQLRDAANAEFDGNYLFGGDSLRTAPYPPGSPQAIYAGSAAAQSLSTNGRADMRVLYTGEQVFNPQARGATVYVGSTGAKAGGGTDNAVGRGALEVRHTLTTFEAGSGVSAGTSSIAGDTIIGPSGTHTLTINDTSGNGTAGTVSINGGTPVAFTSADADLKVQGNNGEIVHLNMTAITPGFQGTVALAGQGSLSRDGGATEVPIDFSTTQAVTDANGKTAYVDSTEIRLAGVEQLEFTGTSDAFQVLEQLRDDLRNTRGLDATEWQNSLTRRMDDINRVHDHVLSVVGDQAQTLKTIGDLETRLDDLTLDAKARIQDVAATDTVASAVALQEAQNLLEYSFAVTAQVFRTSLLDYMA